MKQATIRFLNSLIFPKDESKRIIEVKSISNKKAK